MNTFLLFDSQTQKFPSLSKKISEFVLSNFRLFKLGNFQVFFIKNFENNLKFSFFFKEKLWD